MNVTYNCYLTKYYLSLKWLLNSSQINYCVKTALTKYTYTVSQKTHHPFVTII